VSIGLSNTGPVEFDEPDILLQLAGTRMYEDKSHNHTGLRRNGTPSATESTGVAVARRQRRGTDQGA